MAKRSTVLLAALLLFALGNCERSGERRTGLDRPNLVFVTIDTLRADRLGCYGYFRDTSPVIDALAEESLLFERCLAPIATTFPSHLSLLTGTYPNENGAVANVGAGGEAFASSPRLRSLAELLRSQGYHTAAFVSAVSVKQYTGISAGFELFDEPDGRERQAQSTNTKVFEWLDRVADRPFFLWVHYFDPHDPYRPPPPFDKLYGGDAEQRAYLNDREFREEAGGLVPDPYRTEMRLANNMYDGEIAYTDQQLGELLGRLRSRAPVWNKTVLVLVGDHGEGLGQHGCMYHGGVWREQLHVPLLMRIPGLSSLRVDRLMSIADVVPTLMGLIELPGEAAFLAQASGVDRLDAETEDEPVSSQESNAPWKKRPGDPGPRYMLSGHEWTLIYDAGGEDLLFRRDSDPFELRNVHDDHPEVAERLRETLLARIGRQKQRRGGLRPAAPDSAEAVEARTLEQLRALGYVK